MLTPLDIQNKKFNTGAMGFKKDEVEEFLELVLRDYESMYKENIDLKDKINMLDNALEHYKSIEDTMQNTLLVAQGTAEELRRTAEEKARLILETAESQAKDITDGASRAASDANKEAEFVKHSTELFKAQVIGMLTAQIESLKAFDAAKVSEEDNR